MFQSTHSLRSATSLLSLLSLLSTVSIHALLAECDGIAGAMGNRESGFNPRTPCGVRRMIDALVTLTIWFQSTHSLRSAT